MSESAIPSNAKEIITQRYEDGSKAAAEYFLEGEKIGFRSWYENGQVEMKEVYQNGRRHGMTRRWHPNGQLMWQSCYDEGLEHGTARQLNSRGELLGTYEMDNCDLASKPRRTLCTNGQPGSPIRRKAPQ